MSEENKEILSIMDALGRPVSPGDTVVYASRRGAEIKVAVLVRIFQNGKSQTKMEIRFVNSSEWGRAYQQTPSIVTPESFSKRAILVDPLYWIDTILMKNAFQLGDKIRDEEPI